MLHVLTVVLPVFGLMGLGYAARAVGYVTDRTGEGLSDFVFAVAIPALIFKTLTAADLPTSQPWGYWFSYFGGVLVTWTLATVVARKFFAVSHVEGVVAGFTAGQSNTVLVGIPLILEAFGPEGAVPLFLLIAIHLPITMTTATVLAEGRGVPVRRILRQLVTNPLLIAIAVAVLAREAAPTGLPGAAKTIVDMLGAAASPCALFAMGIALRRYGMGDQPVLAVILSSLKLVVHPLIVLMLARYVFTVPPTWTGVAVMFAAMPCGVNAYLFAERYRTGVAISSGAIAISTAVCVATSAIWLAIMGVR
ncbi:transporter [Alsobacter metallidurans]|uniref:Transporter n=1 Tax=Alsobacter metallidurans TaxID=340221 RepID=A0A917ICM4_9HYPH|nr:AEC family transporter [Alsobacter metallidurans]GGH31044.1 transporter [Alsobacter metallidurans]